jgi:hypothetical protein
MVPRRTVCGEAVERSAGRSGTVDPYPFYTHKEPPLPPREAEASPACDGAHDP